ncbi:unnamed protein product [Arabidopsis halleri]
MYYTFIYQSLTTIVYSNQALTIQFHRLDDDNVLLSMLIEV